MITVARMLDNYSVLIIDKKDCLKVSVSNFEKNVPQKGEGGSKTCTDPTPFLDPPM